MPTNCCRLVSAIAAIALGCAPGNHQRQQVRPDEFSPAATLLFTLKSFNESACQFMCVSLTPIVVAQPLAYRTFVD